MRASYAIGAGMLAVAAWALLRPVAAGAEEAPGSADGTALGLGLDADWLASMNGIFESGAEMVSRVAGNWRAPAEYAPAIAAAEDRNGIPSGMLERLLYQESRYRPEIISGAVRSPAGATGIAQFMPATAADFGINPLDAYQSIDAAGRYLGQLYRRFGTWEQALAAYNWGMGNVARKGMDAAPLETRNYFSQILADLGLA